tara:strand:- start:194 stop:2614 length:2421 start_codon:yes stop_codon:yes gene_type:complete
MITTLYIQGSKLDQQKDESVEINSSVLDISDITRNTGDYTKTFTVPASKSNNKIFKHWYDANIDNSFDARIKVDGEIHLDGILFKIGRFRLTKVNVKKNKPESYTINFFGNLVNLKDTIGKDELKDLDLSYFNHSYNSDKVKQGLGTTGVTSNLNGNTISNRDIIYNLLAKKQYYIDTSTPNTADEKTRNISFLGGDDTGVVWNDLRPSIRILKVIEAIENKYNSDDYENPVVFSRDFFGTTEFNELYMWLNPSENKEPGGDSQIINWDGGDFDYINQATGIGSYPLPANLGKVAFNITITPEAGYQDIDYVLKLYINEQVLSEVSVSGSLNRRDYYNSSDENVLAYYTITCGQKFRFTASLQQRIYSFITLQPPSNTTTASVQTIESNFIVSEEVPKISILDFLKGLFNMFKLVLIPQDDGTLYVDSLDSYYSKGILRDVTRYIDFEKYDVNRGELLNRINLKYSDPKTIVAMQFKNNNDRGYGDSQLTLKDENGKILDGKPLDFTLPFEQIVYERLPNLANNEITNYQYGAIIDESSEPVNPNSLIFYNLLVGAASDVALGFIEDDGTRSQITYNINTPFHHYGLNNPNFALLFEADFSTYTYEALTSNLYTNHYKSYVESIFNPKKRNFVFKAVLPLHIITKLQLNDSLEIKGDYYRIDKYSYNILTGETTLNLINNFEKSISNRICGRWDCAVATKPITDTSSEAKKETIQVTNLQGKTVSKVDLGFGTNWMTLSSSGNNLTFDILENTLSTQRVMAVNLGNGSLVPEVTLIQDPKTLTVDSNIITADSNIITADNNGTTSN